MSVRVLRAPSARPAVRQEARCSLGLLKNPLGEGMYILDRKRGRGRPATTNGPIGMLRSWS
jgi:hypothetical protein